MNQVPNWNGWEKKSRINLPKRRQMEIREPNEWNQKKTYARED